jgi:hypothetical protein
MPKAPKSKDSPADQQNLSNDPKKTWEEDQKKREYYYDDAHGYEVYNPDEKEDDNEKP